MKMVVLVGDWVQERIFLEWGIIFILRVVKDERSHLCVREKEEREKVITRGGTELDAFQSQVNDRTFEAERECLCQRTSMSKHIVVVCLGLALG